MSPKSETGPDGSAGPSDKKPKTEEEGGVKKDKDGKKLPVLIEEELSEEDKQLKEELELCVQRLKENDTKLYKSAMENMKNLIRASTTSMTSVPKPLKFMIPHFEAMKEAHEKIQDISDKKDCADIVSVLAMTMSEKNECLKYRLLATKEGKLRNHRRLTYYYFNHLVVTAS